MNRLQGRLVKWDDERGFGFIETEDAQVFVHIKAIRKIATRPRAGDRVSYAIGVGRDGRPAARDVEIAGANPRDWVAERRGLPERSFARESYRVYAALGLLVLLLAVVILRQAPVWVLAAYAGMAFVSAWNYWLDKRFAADGHWRTSEVTLLGLDLVGGIIGGLLAQHIFRHKTAKPSFAVWTFLIAALHALFTLAVLAGVLRPDW